MNSVGLAELLVVSGAMFGTAIYCSLAARSDSRRGMFRLLYHLFAICPAVTVMLLVPLPVLRRSAPIALQGWTGVFLISSGFLALSAVVGAVSYVVSHATSDGPPMLRDSNVDSGPRVEESGNPYQPPR
jgi:hypothetical protein